MYPRGVFQADAAGTVTGVAIGESTANVDDTHTTVVPIGKGTVEFRSAESMNGKDVRFYVVPK